MGKSLLQRKGIRMNQQYYLREFARYALFSVLGTLGVSCYILADTFFISKGLGTEGLTALNLAIPVYNFIHGTGMMLGMGGATRFSVCKSQGQTKEVSRIYMNTLYLAGLFSGLFFLVGVVGSKSLAVLLGADGSVFEMTNTYLKWLLLFAPAFIWNDVLLCFVRNDEGPKLAMGAMLIGSFGNILLDYVFVFPMKMGMFGAILATGCSPLISMGMMLPHWLRKRNSFKICKTRMESAIVKQELALGFPSLVSQLSSAVVMITFNGLILGLEGNTGVAAYGVIANLSLVVVAVYTGIAQGVQPLISRFYGSGDRVQAKIQLRYALAAMAVVSFAIYLFIVLFARPVTGVFNSQGNRQLQEIAVTGLKLYFTSCLFVGYNIILAVYFTSVERALPAHILSLLRGLVLILPLAFLMAALWGMTGIWLVYPVAEGITAVLGCCLYRRDRKV